MNYYDNTPVYFAQKNPGLVDIHHLIMYRILCRVGAQLQLVFLQIDLFLAIRSYKLLFYSIFEALIRAKMMSFLLYKSSIHTCFFVANLYL